MTIPYPLAPLGQGDHDPFDPGYIVVYSWGPYTYSATLERGVYRLCLVGGGGSGEIWIASSYGWGSAGGSGAAVELIFRNPKRQSVTIRAGTNRTSRVQDGEDSYMDLGGTRMITAGGGKHGGGNYGGAGGIYSINSGLEIIQNIVSNNGNSGTVSLSGNAIGRSVSPYETWGEGNETYSRAGGLRLQYLRLRK